MATDSGADAIAYTVRRSARARRVRVNVHAQAEQRVLQMIQNTEEEHDVE